MLKLTFAAILLVSMGCVRQPTAEQIAYQNKLAHCEGWAQERIEKNRYAVLVRSTVLPFSVTVFSRMGEERGLFDVPVTTLTLPENPRGRVRVLVVGVPSRWDNSDQRYDIEFYENGKKVAQRFAQGPGMGSCVLDL